MHDLTVCPHCGEFAELLELTGWCRKCSRTNGYRICDGCGKQAAHDTTNLCVNCRKIAWLKQNATAIEAWLMQGLSFRQAVVTVIERNRPTCLNCGSPIKHGTNGRSLICTKTPQCRTVRRRYKYLIYEKGKEKDVALREALGLGG